MSRLGEWDGLDLQVGVSFDFYELCKVLWLHLCIRILILWGVVFVALSISNHRWLSLQMTVTVRNLLVATMTRILRSSDGAICSQAQGSQCLEIGHHTDKYPSLCTDIHHCAQIYLIPDTSTCKAYQCPISAHNCPYTPCGHSVRHTSSLIFHFQHVFSY